MEREGRVFTSPPRLQHRRERAAATGSRPAALQRGRGRARLSDELTHRVAVGGRRVTNCTMQNVRARQSGTAGDARVMEKWGKKYLIVLCCAAYNFHVTEMFFHWVAALYEGNVRRQLITPCASFGSWRHFHRDTAVAGDDVHSGIICNPAGTVVWIIRINVNWQRKQVKRTW